MFLKVKPVKCGLMTWECSSSFDAVLSEEKIQEKFTADMPFPCEKTSPILWPMISFNSQEGRLYRYLVALPNFESEQKKTGGRLLPEQIALFHEADKIMKVSVSGEPLNNSGNFLFWNCCNQTLRILVFFEGRLCHWSEESGYENDSDLPEKIRCRLNLFRQFLKQDVLFSRGKSFEERELLAPWNEKSFLLAAKDPCFRKQNLLGTKSKRSSNLKWRRIVFVLLVSMGVSLKALMYDADSDAPFEMPDVSPVELLDPPMEEKALEPVELLAVEPAVELSRETALPENVEPLKFEDSCDFPTFRLKGIVGGKIAVVEEANSRIAFLNIGDSLNDFVVQNVGRERITLACGSEIREVFVR